MGIKLGPKLELSFWAIGYIVLALVLLVVNISWIAGSLDGILHGMKERNVFVAETTLPTADYLEAIQKLLADPSLPKAKREALTARAARLSYNLGKIDTARTLYEELSTSANPDVKTRANISKITIDLESTIEKAAADKEAAKMTAAADALEKLNKHVVDNPNSTDLMAARGAVLMYWFGTADPSVALEQVRKLVAAAQAQEKTNPGIIESRRNLLLMRLALNNFETNPDDEAAAEINKNLRLEAKKIAPYVKDVQKTPLSILLDEIYEKVEAGALGPPTLNRVPTISGLSYSEFTKLVNTIAPGVAETLDGPNGAQNLQLTLGLLKRAQTSEPTNQLNYENIAALNVRHAAAVNENLNKLLENLRSTNIPLPPPFGNTGAPQAAISSCVAEMDKDLADAYSALKAAVAETRIPDEPKGEYCRRMAQIALWRAAITVESSRPTRYNEALEAVSLWQALEPQNTDMMTLTAEIYGLKNDNENQAKWVAKLKQAGIAVAGAGPVANRLDFVRLFPGNPLQVGTSDVVSRDKVVMVGCTFVVSGYGNPVDKNTVKISLNGDNLPFTYLDGMAYTLVPAEKLNAQNKLDFKLALSPQLQKSASIVFKFASK